MLKSRKYGGQKTSIATANCTILKIKARNSKRRLSNHITIIHLQQLKVNCVFQTARNISRTENGKKEAKLSTFTTCCESGVCPPVSWIAFSEAYRRTRLKRCFLSAIAGRTGKTKTKRHRGPIISSNLTLIVVSY